MKAGITLRITSIGVVFVLLGALLTGCSDDAADDQLETREVITQEGPVIGQPASNGAYVWRGIPYAKPPLGDLRWRAPLPPAPRKYPLEANRFGDACVQIVVPLGGAPEELESGTVWGKEDCLFLNIYAPSDAVPAADLPVMFWIHGGGNIVGHSSFYDGSVLAEQQNVIVVTHNYRLGPFGWWRHSSLGGDNVRDASGNYAALDIIRALEWVRDNISGFGGNPEKVTIFGESAGATNVAALITSPMAKGLFHGAIMQSGNAAAGVTIAAAANFTDHPEAPGTEYSSNEMLLRFIMSHSVHCDRACARVHADEMTMAEQAEMLRSIDPATLLGLYGDRGIFAMPTVIRDGRVLPLDTLLESFGNKSLSNAVPMMLGTNKDENKLFMGLNPEYTVMLGGIPLWRRDAELYETIAEYGTLAWKLYGVDEPAVRLYRAGIPVWAYRFDWDEIPSRGFVDLAVIFGAAHAFEIPFVFGIFELGSLSSVLFDEENERRRLALSRRMMSYWAAFARDLNPARGTDGEAPKWQPFAPRSGVTYLHLDTSTAGIRMANAVVVLARLVERMKQDKRIIADPEKCLIFQAAVSSGNIKTGFTEAVSRLDCGTRS